MVLVLDGRSSGHEGAEPQPNLNGSLGLHDDLVIALALSGGNALGAYQAGAYQALFEHGIEPDSVTGASAGSINAAIICGNEPDERLGKLHALWGPASQPFEHPMPSSFETLRRTLAATGTAIAGRPDLFVPRLPFHHFVGGGNSQPASLYDSLPMRETLTRLIDFELLNRGVPRFCATAVDINTGEDVAFDVRHCWVEVDHLRASSALLPAFAPVEIDGRMLADAGISANLPLDSILTEASDRPMLCIAVDLLPLRARRPRTLGETIIRMQDLMFATQSRRAIGAWQALFDERTRSGATASVAIIYVAYGDHDEEVSGKAFDFSSVSAEKRWRQGHDDLARALSDLAAGRLALGEPGLSVYTQGESGRSFERVHWGLMPSRP